MTGSAWRLRVFSLSLLQVRSRQIESSRITLPRLFRSCFPCLSSHRASFNRGYLPRQERESHQHYLIQTSIKSVETNVLAYTHRSNADEMNAGRWWSIKFTTGENSPSSSRQKGNSCANRSRMQHTPAKQTRPAGPDKTQHKMEGYRTNTREGWRAGESSYTRR